MSLNSIGILFASYFPSYGSVRTCFLTEHCININTAFSLLEQKEIIDDLKAHTSRLSAIVPCTYSYIINDEARINFNYFKLKHDSLTHCLRPAAYRTRTSLSFDAKMKIHLKLAHD